MTVFSLAERPEPRLSIKSSQESFEREFAEAGFAVKGDILTSLESRITANRANLQPLPIRYRQAQE